ncbi:MAG: PEP-CTERM sorting domain-containing protein [Verrucomicrobiota bacterium]
MTLQLNFTANALSLYSAAEQQMFHDGLDFWSGIVTGYRDGVSRTWTLEVDAFDEAASGGVVRLGSARPENLTLTGVVADSHLSTTSTDNPFGQRFIIAQEGFAEFNVNADAGTLSELTIRHEIGHAMGIGSLWENNELHNDGVSGNSNRTLVGGTPGEYVGALALAEYQQEFGLPMADFIPVELDGGGGTAGGHWNEVADNPRSENVIGFDTDPGDEGPAPVVAGGVNEGESFDDELMSGVRSGSGFLSNTTVASLYEIGFTVQGFTPIPEPTVGVLLGFGLGCCLRRRRS